MELLILVIILLYIYITSTASTSSDKDKLLDMTNMFENNKLRNNLKKKIYEYIRCLDTNECDMANTLRYEIMDMARSYILTHRYIEELPIKSFQVQLYKLFYEKCNAYKMVPYKAANEFSNKTSWNQ